MRFKHAFAFLAVFVAAMAVIGKLGGVELGLAPGVPVEYWLGGGFGAMVAPQSGPPTEKKLAVLEELGFSFSEEERAELLAQEYPMDYADLLFFQGAGSFDEPKGCGPWEWTPTSDKVYALDTEVFDIGCMYHNFFLGLESISGGELIFSDVTEKVPEEVLESGQGKVAVGFNLNGHRFERTLDYEYDWMDWRALDMANAALAELGGEKRFYAAANSMQGMTIFYCGADWAKAFEKATGCDLHTKAW